MHTKRPRDGLAADVLLVPTSFWSIFALLSADNPHCSDPNAVFWMRRNIVATVAGTLADAYSADHPLHTPHIDDSLRHLFVCLRR